MSTRIIKINRGDSLKINISMPEKNDMTKNHVLATDEAIYFALMYPQQQFEDAIFIKGYNYESNCNCNG